MARDTSSGCLGQILLFPLLLIIAGIVDFCSNTQSALINEAKENNQISYYKTYIRKYPKGKYLTESYDSICSIIARENSFDFEYGHFVYRYLSHCESEELRAKLSNLAYDKALEVNTLKEWKLFIHYVHKEYQRDARQKIAKLEAHFWGTERRAWRTASKRKCIASYTEYMERYPHGRNSRRAKKAVIDLTVAKDFAGEHGSLPTMGKLSNRSTSRTSKLYIKNRTNYTLTLLYSGSFSERLIIDSGSTNSIKLPNGVYRVSARVDADNVRPFVGTQKITGGGYQSEYYIQTTRY